MTGKQISQIIAPWLLGLLAFCLPFYLALTNALIIALAILRVVSGDILRKPKEVSGCLVFVSLLLFYLIHVYGFFLSSNQVEAAAILERRLSLIVFPLIFYNWDAGYNKANVLRFYLAGLMLALFICLIKAFLNYFSSGDSSVFFYQAFSAPIRLNAVYLSAYLVIGYFLADEAVAGWTSKIIKLFFVVGIVLLSSKAMLAIWIIGLLFSLGIPNRSQKYMLLGAGLVVVILTILTVPKIRNRFSSEINADFSVVYQPSYRYDTPFTGITLRLTIWKYSLQILDEEGAWFTGVGTGDFQELLNARYKSSGMYTGNPQLQDTGYLGYGPHNQYMESLLSMGIPGLAAMLFVVFVMLNSALRSGNLPYILFSVLIAIFLFSESALSTNKGIVFFSLFSCWFVQPDNKKVSTD